jgi:hypothetical protein
LERQVPKWSPNEKIPNNKMPFCIFPVIYHFGLLFGNFDFDSFNSSELGIVDININFDV